MVKASSERQIGSLTKVNQDMSLELTQLRTQTSSFSMELRTIREERDILMKESYLRMERQQEASRKVEVIEYVPQISPQLSPHVAENDRPQDDLRFMVSQLKSEVN